MGIKINCIVCNKVFNLTPHRLNSSVAKEFCCSQQCRRLKENEEPNVKCASCGKLFHIKPSRRARTKNPCCSRVCSSKLRETTCLGESNHQYGLKGDLNPTFKSDFYISNYGYIYTRAIGHPFKNNQDFVFLHRLIYEEYLRTNEPESEALVEVVYEGGVQYFLDPNVVIHHRDGNKLNNTLANLEPMSLGDHTALHNFTRSQNMQRDVEGRYISTKPKKLKKTQKNLTKKHVFDAGLDITSSEDVMIPPSGSALIHTDLFIHVPEGYVGLVWSRSGLATKYGIHVGAGCIDSGYNGEVQVLLYNFGKEVFDIKKGDRIGQLLTIPIYYGEYEEVEELPETDRGENGFGSTGRF